MAVIGYARISAREETQVLDRHIEALKAAGCERVFVDHETNADAHRPGLHACLGALRGGDVLVVRQLHQLGYQINALLRFVDELKDRGVGFRALDTVFDTTTPAGGTFMELHAAFAEMERNVIRQRIRAGVAAARARGRKGGRPRLMTPERLRQAQLLMADQTRSIPSICHALGGLPTSTLYHYLRPDGSLKEPGRKLLASRGAQMQSALE